MAKYYRWLPSILWTGAICYLSFTPLEKFSLPKFNGVDKLGHVAMYFVLAALFYFGSNGDKKKIFYTIICAIALAVVTELIQHYFIRNRVGDVWDFVANLLGIILALLVFRNKKQILTER